MARTTIGLPVPRAVRVFVASPKDVPDERAITFQVLKKLAGDPLVEDRVALQIAAWDERDVPMLSGITPQEAVLQSLGRPSQCDIVIVILRGRIGTALDPRSPLVAETSGESGTLWEYREAVKASRETGRPDVLVYYREPRPGEGGPAFSDPDYAEKHDQWQKLQAFLAEFRNPDGSYVAGLNTYKGSSDFKRLLDRHLRYRLRWLLAPEASDASRGRRRELVIAPFPGLDAFTTEQADFFFGRAAETDGLVVRMSDVRHRFLAVVGGSGVGKSSIVAAGLIPRLEGGAVEGSADWIRLRFTPGAMGDDPMLSFAACLGAEATRQPVQLAANLASGQSSIEDVIRSLVKNKPTRSEVLVFVDQFEELFTHSTAERRECFLRLMEAGMATGRLRFVATLRAEFYARAIEDARLAAWLRDGSYPLASPGLAQALEMITGPAEEAGLSVEDGLAQRIVDAFGADLPLLAFAMSKLYEKCGPDGQLTHGMFDSLGLADMIDSRAEQAFDELKSDQDAQASMDAVFLKLVSLDDQQTVTRRRATLEGVATSRGASLLIEKLVDARLLKTERRSDGEPVVSVAHEAVLVHWRRLKNWIDRRKDKLRLLHSVRTAAAEWDRQNRADELLWSERRMKSVYATIEDLRPDLTPLERRFLGIGDAAELVEELGDPMVKHARRTYIGDRLSELGDTRAGVGIREDGTADIVWCDVAGGEVLTRSEEVIHVDRFRMAKYPITWRQFRAFLEDPQGYFTARWWEGLPQPSQGPRPHRLTPDNGSAEDVTWYDAVAFCRWLGARLGFEVRLATEAEWRRAAMGDDRGRAYPWGSQWNPDNANTEESGLARVTAVGLYPHAASPFGIQDMAGNLWEWCQDEYGDPDRRVGADGPRVVKGGAWSSNREAASALMCERDLPDFRGYHDHGFRVCMKESARPLSSIRS